MFLGPKILVVTHFPLDRGLDRLAVRTWTSNHKADGKALVK